MREHDFILSNDDMIKLEEALLLNERTIHCYRDKFIKGGIDRLVENRYKGGFCKLSPDEEIELARELRNNIDPTSASVCTFTKKEFNKHYAPQDLMPLLHSTGFSYKKTKAVPGKLKAEDQKKVVKQYESTKKQGKKVYSGDLVHLTYKMMPDFIWLPAGEETHIKSNPGRKRVNIFCAYSPDDNNYSKNVRKLAKELDFEFFSTIVALYEKRAPV